MKTVKINLVYLLISCLVILSYMSSVFSVISIEYTIANVGIVLVTIFFSILVIVKKGILDIKTIILAVLAVVLIIATQRVESVSLLCLVFLNCVYNPEKNNNYIKWYFFTSISCFGLILAANQIFGFNLINDGEFWRNTLGGYSGGISRRALGFTHPNQASIKWLSVVISGLAYSYTNNDKLFKKYLLLFLVSSIYLLNLTKSRTVAVVVIFSLAVLFFMNLFKKNNNNFKKKKILEYFPVFFLFFSFLMIFFSKNVTINNFLSGRPQFYLRYIEQYGISFWGNVYLDRTAIVDNSYLHMVLTKGIIFYLIYTLINANFFVKIQKIYYVYAVLLISIFTVSMFETILLKFEIALLILILIKSNQKDSGES